jgi:hypothetical protein
MDKFLPSEKFATGHNCLVATLLNTRIDTEGGHRAGSMVRERNTHVAYAEVHDPVIQAATTRVEYYHSVRQRTVALCVPLRVKDHVVKPVFRPPRGLRHGTLLDVRNRKVPSCLRRSDAYRTCGGFGSARKHRSRPPLSGRGYQRRHSDPAIAQKGLRSKEEK